ncbi:MAG TPA: hypothetical protein VJ749_04650 [Pyrinomonadaceae bacterium]|jgi:hypothetical protein|nr:hypothetical protein [Pyrinomonadaceae bacterium]
MKRSLISRCGAIAVIVLSLLAASSSFSVAQQNSNSANKDLPLHQIVKLPGKVLAEAKTTGTTNNPKLTGYRVEEVALPRSISAEVRGQQVNVDRAWRVTVTGGPFPVRAMPAMIWIDDQLVGLGIENKTLSEVTAITFDESLLTDGGVVSLSYGGDKERLSPKLQLKRGGQNQ